jgi:nucleotide-binding universal stress UspA family protein
MPDATVESIVAEAQRLNADMIVVGSHHHGALYNLVVGSVTGDVLKRAKCPVLVVPND